MKKIIALFLALSMLFALTACGGNDESTPTGESTGETTSTTESTTNTTDGTEDSTQGTTEGTEATTEATTPETTIPPTTEPNETKPTETTPPETQPTHTHSYSSKVTTAATCTADGVNTYTCSCGKSYTESIKATGHSMGGWKEHSNGGTYTVGETRNSCANCSHYESKMQFDAFFEKYVTTAFRLGEFSSVNELTADRIVQTLSDSVAYTSSGRNDQGGFCVIFKMEDVNTHTLNRFGRTFDYATMGIDKNGYTPTNAGGCRYDAETNTLIEERYESDGRWPQYVSYTTTDNVHFVVTYKVSDGETSDTHTCNIELIGGKYIITSQKITRG